MTAIDFCSDQTDLSPFFELELIELDEVVLSPGRGSHIAMASLAFGSGLATSYLSSNPKSDTLHRHEV